VRRAHLLSTIAIVLACLLAPLVLNPYWVRVATKVLLFAGLASGWNLIAGFCGYPSFGQVVFFGLGAYATAVAMVRLHWPFVVGLVIGVVVAMVFAVLIGLPVLRLRGHYFAVATLGVAEAMKQVIANLGFTGGGEGISFPLPPWTPETTTLVFYYALGAVLLALLGTLWLARRSRMGYAWRGIRVNEEAAQVLGVNTTYYKVVAWTLSAGFTALAGGIYGYWIAFIEPNTMFSPNVMIEMVVIALLGGVGTIVGPVLGAVVFEVLSEVVWAQFLNVHALVLAILVGVIIMFLPGGLIRYLERAPARPTASRAAR
jgi:branched-chain amino acid transport system permease protein